MLLGMITGISGSGRKEYLKDFLAECERKGKKVKVYHIGQMLFEQARKVGVNITPENVLNTNPAVINSLRSAVLENVTGSIKQEARKYDLILISLHTFFYWKKIFTRAYDWFYLKELSPDFFVTFIDKSQSIKARLDSRAQWKDQNLSCEEILLWQNIEVEVTADLAELYRKPFYVISVSQPISTLYRLVFRPEMKLVYVSMPMTHLSAEKRAVDKFVERLRKYFIVFDPRTIEIEAKKIVPAIYHQTVKRDLYWLIKQCSKVVAFYPRVVSSPGVINELREAYETNKDVWVIFPSKKVSPFLLYYSTKLFRNQQEFFKFLESKVKETKK